MLPLTNEELYLHRCLQLAELAKGQVHPNPMVGAVVVCNDKIIGEGYHQIFGWPHAEVNAINSVKNKGLLKNSTLYVNLEPCCHWGKTPPCTNLIIESGIKKVVIGCLDLNPLVAGKGVKILEDAEIIVTTKVLEDKSLKLNEDFFEQFKPNKIVKFILKWAESSDGFMGKQIYNSPEERELSNGLVKRFVHKIRSDVDAIMIGTNAALIDNPLLDNRYWNGKLPKAILIDKTLKIPLTSNVFKPARTVVILNETKEETSGNVIYKKIDFNVTNDLFWQTIQDIFTELEIRSVLLEGGSTTLQSFINSKLTCKIIRIKTTKIWNDGIKAPLVNIKVKESFQLGDNLIEMGENHI